jgi:flagellar L-ring protein precursor FlgH
MTAPIRSRLLPTIFLASGFTLLAPTQLYGQATPPAGTAATTPPAAAAAATAPAAPKRGSWTADRRDFVVGDIITVLIDDYTISTAVKENVNSDTRTRGLSVSARLPESSKNIGIDSRNAADQTQRGQARRENRFQNEMSVRVVAVGPNGLLQVKGTKVIDVDKAKQDIAFTGWVRAQDVSVSNVIESSRVADAQIGYASPGPLGKPKQGIITKVLGALWP